MITTQQLQLLKEGNKNAFEALYRGYNARIYNFVLSMVPASWFLPVYLCWVCCSSVTC